MEGHEPALCRRAKSHMLANAEKTFVQLKPSPLGRAPSDFPSLPAVVPDCTRGLWPWAAFPGWGSCKTAFESQLGGGTTEEQKL